MQATGSIDYTAILGKGLRVFFSELVRVSLRWVITDAQREEMKHILDDLKKNHSAVLESHGQFVETEGGCALWKNREPGAVDAGVRLPGPRLSSATSHRAAPPSLTLGFLLYTCPEITAW